MLGVVVLACGNHAVWAADVTRVDVLGGAVALEVRTSSGKDVKVRWKRVRERAVVVEVPELFVVEKVEDLNADGVVEIWGVQSNPDELYLDLYQIDLRKLSGDKLDVYHDAKSTLSAFAGSRDSFAYVRREDIDGDGRSEVVVRVPTHPLFGSLYSRGRLYWEDIYELDPWARLANSKHKGRFARLRSEIDREIARLLKYAQSLDEKSQRTAEPEKLVYELRANEARDQIEVYREWLAKIDKL